VPRHRPADGGVHKDYGQAPWAKLLRPAIKLAEDGFAVSHRLNWWLTSAKDFLGNAPDLKAVITTAGWFRAPVGEVLKSPELAKTLHNLAEHGAASFMAGAGQEIVKKGEARRIGGRGPAEPRRLTWTTSRTIRRSSARAVCGPYSQI